MRKRLHRNFTSTDRRQTNTCYKMFSESLLLGSVSCVAVLVSVISAQPTYLLPQQRNQVSTINIEEPVSSSVEYQIVPASSEYAVATIEPTGTSLMDYVLSPVTAVVYLGSTALSAASWVIINGSLVLLGMVIVFGFCALTPYCTLTIEKPSYLARENEFNIPYFDDLEYYISEAYNKYQEMQNSL